MRKIIFVFDTNKTNGSNALYNFLDNWNVPAIMLYSFNFHPACIHKPSVLCSLRK